MGIVNTKICVADEPGSWEVNGGQLMADALFTAQGKPNSPLKLIMIGTLSPMATGAGHWWYDLIDDGTRGSVWVKTLQGDAGEMGPRGTKSGVVTHSFPLTPTSVRSC